MTPYNHLKQAVSSANLDNAFTELYGPDNIEQQKNRYINLLNQLEKDVPKGTPFFVSAPGRTELGGNHTDHNRGHILAAAVDLDCVAAVTPVETNVITITSPELEAPAVVDLEQLVPIESEQGTATALIRGVAAAFADNGFTPKGFFAHVHATCLPGIGISSSAAVSVLVAEILFQLDPGADRSAILAARMAQKAENDFFGKPCGLMDQMASAVGRIIFVDFKDPNQPGVEKIVQNLDKSGFQLCLIDTGGCHTQLTPEYAAVPKEMCDAAKAAGGIHGRDISRELFLKKLPDIRRAAGDRAALRLLHFIDEDKRVRQMADFLKKEDFPQYLEQVARSGASSCNLLQDCASVTTTDHQGILLARAVTDVICPRAICRVHGGGFAGTAQAYVPTGQYDRFVAQMETVFGVGNIQALRIGRPGMCVLTTRGLDVPE